MDAASASVRITGALWFTHAPCGYGQDSERANKGTGHPRNRSFPSPCAVVHIPPVTTGMKNAHALRAGVPGSGPVHTPCAKRMCGTGEIHPDRCTEHLRSRRSPIYSFGRNHIPRTEGAFTGKPRVRIVDREGRPPWMRSSGKPWHAPS